MAVLPPLRRLSTLTIVSPFYNEELGARLFYEELCRHLNALYVTYDFVFVDDGSSDKTLSVLNELAQADSRITVLALSRNFGHQIALTAGLDYAEGEAVICMDSDLQHPPQSIGDMIAKYETGADIVYAVRNNDDNRDLAKQLVARGFYQIMRRVTRLRFVPGAVDFRLMSAQLFRFYGKCAKLTGIYVVWCRGWALTSRLFTMISKVGMSGLRGMVGGSSSEWRDMACFPFRQSRLTQLHGSVCLSQSVR